MSHTLASFEIELADGGRRIVRGVTRATSVAELLDVIGSAGGRAGRADRADRADIVSVDGRLVDPSTQLAGSGIRHGSLLEIGSSPDRTSSTAPACCNATWMTGPDAGGHVTLSPGEHVVGRSPLARVRCDDPDLELHHAVLVVGADDSASVHQIAGRLPLVIDGEPADGPVELGHGARIEIGGSVLRIGANEAVSWPDVPMQPSDARDPWRAPHVRVPRPIVDFAPEPIALPVTTAAAGHIAGTLWPTLLAVAASGALAAVLGQVMFLMFGLLGAVVAFGTWVAQRVGLVRLRSRAAAARAAAWQEFGDELAAQRLGVQVALHANASTIVRAAAVMRHDHRPLWAVRAGDPDAFRVAIGEGEGRWEPEIARGGDASAEVWHAIESFSRLGTVPVLASLASGRVVAVTGGTGRERAGVARSMVVQLAAMSGPADWRLLIVADDGAWGELEWLAHLRSDDGSLRRSTTERADSGLGGIDASDDRHLVVLLDRPDLLRTRTSALRRLMATGRSVAVIVLCANEAEVPACCTSMLVLGSRGQARWTVDTTAHALAEPVRFAGVSAARATEAVRAIAHLCDPEHVASGAGVPADVSLVELLAPMLGRQADRFAHSIADQWSGVGVDPPPSTPIGVAADGIVELDLQRDGPHGLIAGTTGSGKSELLRSLVLGLAVAHRPELLTFVLIDYKGGATFDGLAELPHVVGVVTDLDDRLAGRALRSMEAELRRRERLLREAGVTDLGEHRRAVDAGRVAAHLARLVVVIDEFAGLAVQQPGFLDALLGIAQRGRSLGLHLILATQRPAGVVSDDIRANTQLRIALRVHDAADAVDVIADAGAAHIPRAFPGRAMMRLGADTAVTFQTARCTRPLGGHADARLSVEDPSRLTESCAGDSADHGSGPVTLESTALVHAIRAAAVQVGCPLPPRPWLPPLAPQECFDTTTMDHLWVGAVGVVDDPDRQCRLPLRVPVDGHLLLVGSVGMGTTTAAVAAVGALACDEAELYVLDALGDTRIEALGDVACVVQIHERERVHRLLAHLAGVIAARAAGVATRGSSASVVVVIEGYGALRASLERDEDWARLEELDRIVAEGAACGVRCILTAARPGAVPAGALADIAHRWIFHLDEPLEGPLAGVPAQRVPGAVPGRLVVAATGLEAQVFVPCGMPKPGGKPTAATIRVLPTRVSLRELPPATAGSDGVFAPVAMDFATLTAVTLPIGLGEHALILGTGRSGRTTALRTLAAAWQCARPFGRVVNLAPRRSGAAIGERIADVAGVLTVIDDSLGRGEDLLVVIDDAELVDDPSGRLAALVMARSDHLTVLAAARPEALRSAYGHWTNAVRRSRLGLVMAGCTDLDADLLGVVMPRRMPIPPRPGLGWVVAGGGQQLAQIAVVNDPSTGARDPVTASLDAVCALP